MNGPKRLRRRTDDLCSATRAAATLATAAGHTDSYVDCSGRVGRVRRRARPLCVCVCDALSSARVHMVVVVSPRQRRPWLRRWCCGFSPFLLVLLAVPWSAPLDRVVPLLLAYALMPPPAADRVTATVGARVRETKRALLGGGRCSRVSPTPSRPSSVASMVAAGTVSKITEKFQALPHAPAAAATTTMVQRPPRVVTRIPKPLPGRNSGPSPPPLPLLPPPVVKYEIKRRQEKLFGELHPGARPPLGPFGDSAISSDCGSSSDSEKSVRSGGVVEPAEDKPGSPHSSGYESVDETAAADRRPVVAAVPYSWVFGGAVEPPSHDFDASSSSSSSASSSSDGCYVDDVPEDRLERLVTFAPPASCPALTYRAKPDQDGGGGAPAAVRRHFGGNDVATSGAAAGGCLSPIPEYYSSTEPNSVETVEECCYDTDAKVLYYTTLAVVRAAVYLPPYRVVVHTFVSHRRVT